MSHFGAILEIALRRAVKYNPHVKLAGLPRTLLFTLRARAEEHGRPHPILSDPLAHEWYGRVRQTDDLQRVMAKAYTAVFQLGTAVRARLYDEMAGRFVDGRQNPVIVELGAGLSTRFHRLRHHRAHWMELDLPEAIAFRRRFDAETERHTFLPYYMLDEGWLAQIPAVNPADVLFLAEGVLFFLTPDEIERLFGLVHGRFPRATFAFDILTEGFNSKSQAIFAANDAPMRWLVPAGADFSALGLAAQTQQVVTHHFTPRWQSLGFQPEKLRQNQGNILITGQLTGKNSNLR